MLESGCVGAEEVLNDIQHVLGSGTQIVWATVSLWSSIAEERRDICTYSAWVKRPGDWSEDEKPPLLARSDGWWSG